MTDLPDEEFNKLYNCSHANFENIRVEIYSKIMDDPEISQENARKYMQKAYVSCATISSLSKDQSKEATRARWPNLVQQTAQEHGKLINGMAKGKFYDNIEKDPRDTVGADDKIDLKSLPQYQGLST